MITSTMAMLGYMDIVLILAVMLLMFGAKKLPELAKGLGTGIKEFKKATQEAHDGVNDAAEDQLATGPKRVLEGTSNGRQDQKETKKS